MRNPLNALILLLATMVAACAHAPAPPEPGKAGLDCIFYNPITGQCTYAPEPPPGGRKCDSRGNTTINPGEFAAYTGPGAWCITLPGGDYPNMASYFFNWGGPGYIVNKRSGYPAPPLSLGYYGVNYTGGGISMYPGTYTPAGPLRSLRVR